MSAGSKTPAPGERSSQRVPVASLASREQGVEAVGAAPVGEVRRGHYGGRSRNIGFQQIVLYPDANLMDGTKLYTAPPSSKTQDDLAGAGAGTGGTRIIKPPKFAPRSSITDSMSKDDLWSYACLVGYRYKLSEHDKLQSTLASQPKATAPVPLSMSMFANRADFEAATQAAPVPVVQGEARIGQLGKVSAALIRLDAIYRDLVDTEVTPDRPTWLRDALHIAEALATPANMAVGAVGGVGARIVVQARKLLTELDDYFKRTKTLDVNVAYRCDKLERALNATPATEQATTGSGPGAIVSAYSIPASDKPFAEEITIQRMRQIEGPALWSVKLGGNCLSKSGEWEWEPMPSSRDDEFLARCRFDSPEAAIRAAILSTASPAGEGEGKA